MSPDALRAFWFLINVVGFLVGLSAASDARDNRRAIKLLNGHARELATSGAVRREGLRLLVYADMLLALVPGIGTGALLLIPVILLVSSLLDARERRNMTAITAAELVIEREDSIAELRRLIIDNTRISKEASAHAQEAFHEANDLNLRMSKQDQTIIDQGLDRKSAQDKLSRQVSDIHRATVDEA